MTCDVAAPYRNHVHLFPFSFSGTLALLLTCESPEDTSYISNGSVGSAAGGDVCSSSVGGDSCVDGGGGAWQYCCC